MGTRKDTIINTYVDLRY